MATIRRLLVESIRTDGGTQTRVRLDQQVLGEYAEALAAGQQDANWPPIVVFYDGTDYWLADGFHRVMAAVRAKITHMAADVRKGGQIDALRHALGANGAHGLRRTHDDIANAIRLAYENRKALGLPDDPAARVVGDLVGVSHHTAETQLAKFASWRDATHRTGKDGKKRPIPPCPPPRKPSTGQLAQFDEPQEQRVANPPPPAGRSETPTRSKAPVDAVGRAIPEALLELWGRSDDARELVGLVSQVRVALRRAQEARDPLWAEINYSSVLSLADRLYAELGVGVPHAVCPHCQGHGCKACSQRGLISKFRWETTVPKELKDAVAKVVGAQA